MEDDLSSLSLVVQALLKKYGEVVLPLTAAPAVPNPDALLLEKPARELFPRARHPQAAMSGMLLLLSQWAASHSVSQSIESPEGSYWHAIAHRMEPDSFNASYWFRRVGKHAIFPGLRDAAASILSESALDDCKLKSQWDPLLFIEWCDHARQQPGLPLERAMLAIQKVEWELLFSWCSEVPS